MVSAVGADRRPGNGFLLPQLVNACLIETVRRGDLAWSDVKDPTPADIAFLGENYPFHPLNLEDCTSKRQLAKLDQREEYIFLVVHFPLYEPATKLVLPRQLCMFVGNNYVITVHDSGFKLLGEIFEECKQKGKVEEEMMGRSPANLSYQILDRLTDDIFPLADRIAGNVDDIEDKVFDQRTSAAVETTNLQREIAALRRLVMRLRRVVTDLSTSSKRFSKRDLSPYFGDLGDHLEKLLEVVDEASETMEIFSEADYDLSTEKTNRVLSILTIVFTLTIPLTVLSGIYGMNVLVPGGIASGNWAFLGPYTTLILILLVAFIPAAAFYLYMRSHRWI
jgi:magnesium transporter